ncbi:MAG: ABC transporter permease [Pseudomonadales bacterium]|nr:ABC transporter permease [Pseudomonadales bacterium]
MSANSEPTGQPPQYRFEQRAGQLVLELAGDWLIATPVPAGARIVSELQALQATRLEFDCTHLGAWDSVLVILLIRCRELCLEQDIEFAEAGLPEGARRLMALALEVPAHQRPPAPRAALLRYLVSGEWLRNGWLEIAGFLAFIGEVVIALVRLASGRANTRMVDFLWFVQQAGPAAIGIVTLISVLVGMILAYLGSVQLQQFGAQIYVADLVGIGMVREMGALMTGVIMAGRTGAAYAAQLGTMQTREEIDAISTLGMSPIEFLVVPRMLALVLVMPLLCVYSDVLGMVGGALVALGMDVSWTMFVNETREAVTLTHITTGVVKSVVFGVLIAVAGCRAGIQCGRSSEAVGQAATVAVVTAIVYIVVADAAFNILYQRLGI